MPSAIPSYNYNQWIEWLEQRSPMPEKGPSLQPIVGAFKETGLLDKINSKKVIHIAGTNGKGTTAKTLQKLLASQNQRVGLYTSPHLVDTTERIIINETPISQEKFLSLMATYYEVILKHNLSHFEVLTLFAVAYFFKTHSVDWAIFEIGLGGTWDATNAIAHHTSVITALGFDHQQILGDTLEEIADNKLGIIQTNNDVFHLPFPNDEITELSQVRVKEKTGKQYTITPPQYTVSPQKNSPLPTYTLHTPWGDTEVSLPGARAAENMWLALNVFQHLGYSAEKALATLAQIHWPARMTLLPQKTRCPIYLSGDHNIQGIESLVEILTHATYRQLHLVLGLSKNRSHTPFIEKLKTLPRSRIVLTRPSFRGVDPETKEFPFFKNPSDALNSILAEAHKDDLVVVTGSLYLCGDVLRA